MQKFHNETGQGKFDRTIKKSEEKKSTKNRRTNFRKHNIQYTISIQEREKYVCKIIVDNIMQYRANRQMAPCCEKNDALEGMPLAMAYVHGRCGESFMMQKRVLLWTISRN